MKGIADEPQYSVGLLDGGTALCDVIDNYIDEQTVVRAFPLTTAIYQNTRLIRIVWKRRRICCVLASLGSEYWQLSFFLFTNLSQSEKNAFFVADLGAVMRQHVRWRTRMPLIRPYYAVRCNSSPAVIELLASLGSGFTCSNKVTSSIGWLEYC